MFNYARSLHIKDQVILLSTTKTIPLLDSHSIRIIAGGTRSRVVCLHSGSWRRSWRSFIGRRRIFLRRPSGRLRSPLRGVDFRCSLGWLVNWRHRSTGVIDWRRHIVQHAVLTSLWVGSVVYGWILVIRIVSRPLVSIEKPLPHC
jgi:hypothetical protein